jgi:hypothetical protein
VKTKPKSSAKVKELLSVSADGHSTSKKKGNEYKGAVYKRKMEEKSATLQVGQEKENTNT